MIIKPSDQPAVVQEALRALLNQKDITVHKVVIYASVSDKARGSGLVVTLDPRDPETVDIELKGEGSSGLLESDAKRRKNQLIRLLLETVEFIQINIMAKEAEDAPQMGNF